MQIAIIGATGLVGQTILKVLSEFNIKIESLIPVASNKSIGNTIQYNHKTIKVVPIETALQQKPEIAIFSAGSTCAMQWAPKFASIGTTVIDNSSAFRMDKAIKLIVPEINGKTLTKNDKIIANPNCSTIQMVMALAPLHKKYQIKRLVISTYQSVTGSGAKGIAQLKAERKGNLEKTVCYPYQIDLNCLPVAGGLAQNGYTTEEQKLENETQKILNDNGIKITATAVRVPVFGGHSESVNIEFKNNFELQDVETILHNTAGIKVLNNYKQNVYPMPLYCYGKNDVFVGRIRRDYSIDNGLNIWIVSDNLRKGAATNAVQIAQYLINKKLV